MSRDTTTGLEFEKQTNVSDFLKRAKGFREVAEGHLERNGTKLLNLKGNKLYSFLENNGINYKEVITRKLIPDECFLSKSGVLYVFEKKFQQTAGSADEKLQTCHFKKMQYQKLMNGLGVQVEYIYILSDWFKQPMYGDVLHYIRAMGCHYRFTNDFYTYEMK